MNFWFVFAKNMQFIPLIASGVVAFGALMYSIQWFEYTQRAFVPPRKLVAHIWTLWLIAGVLQVAFVALRSYAEANTPPAPELPAEVPVVKGRL